MLGLSRRTHAEQVRSELGESWEHLLAAATHAANGVGRSVGPQTHRMRDVASRGWGSTSAALAPLMVAYREGAADGSAAALKLKDKTKSRKKGKDDVAKKKTGMLVGLLAVGAAVGAASALMMRRRRKQQWSEYDPTEALDSVSSGTRSMQDKSAMDKMTSRASTAMDKTADKLHSAASSMRKTKSDERAEAANDATDDLTSKYSTTTSTTMDNRL